MSTRANIGFFSNTEADHTKPEQLIYRHSDGYPEGVLPELVPFLERFQAKRGLSDSEYASARTLQHLTNLYDQQMQEYGGDSIYAGYLGYGICSEMHGDIEWFYAVYPNRLEVYERTGSWDDIELELNQTIKLEKTNATNGI